MTDASVGYLKGLFEPTLQEVKQTRAEAMRKAQLENLKLEEDTALCRARAAAALRQKGQFISNKHGVWQYDPETEQLKSIYEAPASEQSKPDDIVKLLP